MGLFDKIIDTLAPKEEAEYEEQGYAPEQPAYIPKDPRTQEQAPVAPITNTAPVRHQNSGTNVMGSAIEMKVVKPDRYEAVADIADLLLQGNTVLLNLEDTNKEATRRIIDFMTGVAYAIRGDLRRIANNTYVVTPNNVRVSDSDDGAEVAATVADEEA